MRSSKTRSRSKQNRNRSVGNVLNRVFDSSGPEGKVRGTPQQIIEKYNQLARDAQLSNDRVAAENFQQHAEHYLRILGEATREQDARREIAERENKERQAERDRDRSDRQPTTAAANPSDDMFVNDLSQDDQPEVLSMPVVDNELGLIETPENRKSERNNVSSDQSKSSRKPQAQRGHKPAKTAISTDASISDSPLEPATDNTSVDKNPQATV
jgi:hypothetical protein